MRKKSFLTLVLIASLAGFTLKSVNTSPSNPLVAVDPKISSGSAGTTISINVTVTNVTDLFSYDGNLTYNPNILNCTSCEEGPFLGTAGLTWWQTPVIDNYNGWIFFGNTLWFPPLASGNGTLATITFDVLVEGRTPLNLSETDLNTLDEEGVSQNIPHDKENGVFTIPGDVNGDGYVNALDVGKINAHWCPAGGPPPWSLGYDPNVDVNEDGYINALDIGVVNANWG